MNRIHAFARFACLMTKFGKCNDSNGIIFATFVLLLQRLKRLVEFFQDQRKNGKERSGISKPPENQTYVNLEGPQLKTNRACRC